MVGDGKGDGDSVGCLPDAILEDILSRLYSKTLVKLSIVCKKWKSLISTGDFKRLHQEKSHESPNLLFFSRCSSKGYFLTTTSLVGEVLDQWNIFSPRSSLSSIIMPPSQCGPNNNLVCFIVKGKRFAVCNPSFRKLLDLPQPPYSKTVRAYGFCFLPSRNQYVIVSLSGDQWQMITFCNTNDFKALRNYGWKPIKNINAPHREEMDKPGGVCTKGVLYWMGSRYNHLLCFDLYKETFFTVACPADRIYRGLLYYSLHDLKGDLHLMRAWMSLVTLWKLDATTQTWIEQYEIDILSHSYLRPLMAIEDGEILFEDEEYLEWYGLGNDQVFTRRVDKRIPPSDFRYVRNIKVHNDALFIS